MATRKWAPLSRIILIVVMCFVTKYILVDLAFGWSLQETYKFSTEVFGAYAMSASWVFQLGPQVFFAMAEMAGKKRPLLRKIFIGTAIVLNLVDTATNISAFNIGVTDGTYIRDLRPELRPVGLVMGYVACFGITWGEEVSILAIGAIFHLIGAVMADFGRKPPSWFLVDGLADIALVASGGKAAGVDYGGSSSRNKGGGGKRQEQRRSAPPPNRPSEAEIAQMREMSG